MSILDMTLQDVVETAPVFAGDSYTFVPDGTIVAGGVHLADKNALTYMSRVQMTIKNRPTVLNAKTGILSREKRSVSIAIPHGGTNNVTPGAVSFTTCRFELENHPEASDQAQLLVAILVNFLTRVGNQNFLVRGSLS